VAPELVLPAAEPPCVPSLLLPFVELQADTPNANASKPAKTTLWCFCFMIDSFCWNFSVGCVTMPLATSVRGANRDDVPVDSGWH
jgi:hypothetical protein